MNRSLIIAIFLVTAAFLAATVSCTDDKVGQSPTRSGESTITSVVSEAQWEQALAGSADNLLVAEFYASWCAPCRKLAPVLEALAERYKGRVEFYRIDVDARRKLAGRYQVRGIPYTVLIRNRKVVDSLFGLQPAANYRNRIERQLAR